MDQGYSRSTRTSPPMSPAAKRGQPTSALSTPSWRSSPPYRAPDIWDRDLPVGRRSERDADAPGDAPRRARRDPDVAERAFQVVGVEEVLGVEVQGDARGEVVGGVGAHRDIARQAET